MSVTEQTDGRAESAVQPESTRSVEYFLGFTLVFVIGEILIFGRFGELGLLVHVLGMLLLFVTIYRSDPVTSLLYQSMVLIPLLRIFNFGIPLFTENSLQVLGILYSFLLISIVQVIRSQQLSLADIGLSVGKSRVGLVGLGVGLGFGAIQFGFALEGLEYPSTLTNYVLVVLTTGLLIGLVEELIFRGLIQRRAATFYGDWTAIIATSVIFAFMHSIWLNPADILFTGLVSLFIGWSYARWNNMWFIVGLHAMINVSAFLIYPLLVPDLQGEVIDLLSALIGLVLI